MYFVEKGLNEDESKKLYLGAFIRYEREKEEMTLGFMSTIVGITKSFLSDIEHGKKMPADYTLNKIMSVLDIEFHDDVAIHEEALEKLKEMYQLYSDGNIEEMMKLNQTLVSDELIYKNSYAFLTYDLIRFVYELNVNSDIVKCEKFIEKLDIFYHLLSKKEMVIYDDAKGMFYYKKREFKSAEQFYKNALESATTNVQKALICYHLTLLYQLKNNQLDSLIYCEQSIQYYNREYNIYRLLHLEIFKGTCYAREGLFDKAINIYEKVIENAKKSKFDKVVSLSYCNIAWTYMKAFDYEKVIENTKLSLEYDENREFREIYMYIPFSLYKLKRYEECLQLIEKNNKYLENDAHFILLKAIQARIKGKDTLFVQYMQEYIQSLSSGKYEDYEMYLFAYHELLDYYKSVNDQVEIIHTYDKMMEIINLVS